MRSIWLFLGALPLTCLCAYAQGPARIMTVNGPIAASEMGSTLIHEHLLVDFIGADKIDSSDWKIHEVVPVVMPYLIQIRNLGTKTLVECTPSYLGRDVRLLKKLADESGINLITNTGYYGAVDNAYIPEHAFRETAEELAIRWIGEWENGIDGTEVKPGFIKIGVNPGSLSPLHKKLVTAAAITHLKTGLTVASHTGPSLPAFEQIDLFEQQGVAPDAFIWVHAQNEKDKTKHVQAAQRGAWVSLDGISDTNLDTYLDFLLYIKSHNQLHRVLISHDAGWYRPREENGGNFRPFTTIAEKFIPLLKRNGFTEQECHQLLVENPANAFAVETKRLR
nr:phosphotriesterase [Cytophagales bacterium]